MSSAIGEFLHLYAACAYYAPLDAGGTIVRMTINDTTLISELDRLSALTGRDVGDLVAEILRKHFGGDSRSPISDPHDQAGSGAQLLAEIRADFEEVGWMDIAPPARRAAV
jgi:hypothetical protein